MVSGKRMIRRLSVLLLSATLALSACEKSAKEKLSEAYSAIQSKDADRAEAAIKDALAKEPDAEQAPVLMAQVHRLRAQYEKAEQELDGAWKKNSLDGDKLSTQQKRMKQLFTEEYYPELYREWAESIDAVANPQKFEEIVLKGLKHEKDDKYLNTMLVEFYGKYAEKLIEQGKKAQGADTLEKIKPLYTSSKIRNEALTRASALRLEVSARGRRRASTRRSSPSSSRPSSSTPRTTRRSCSSRWRSTASSPRRRPSRSRSPRPASRSRR